MIKTSFQLKTKAKKGRPKVKTSEKLIPRKARDNRTKKYGFVLRMPRRLRTEGKSPPAKAKRIEIETPEEETVIEEKTS